MDTTGPTSPNYPETLRDLTRYQLMAQRRELVGRLKPGQSIQITAVIHGKIIAISNELERRNEAQPTSYQRVQGWVAVLLVVGSLATCALGAQ